MITRIYATDTGAAWGTRTLIWRSDRVDDTTMAYAVQCSTEVNKAPTLKFTVGPEHPYYYLFKKKKTILTVTEDSTNADDPDGEENNGDACLFRGCVQELEADIYQQLTVTAEGALLYLEDSLHVPTGKNKRKVSRRTLMQSIVDDHNTQMTSEPEKQFTLGTIGSFQGKMDRVGNDEEFSDTSYETNMSFFSSHVKDECNGYLRVRYNRNFSTHYLDFLEAYGTEASQHLRFAVNIEDISHEDVSEDLYTVLVPVGKNAITLQGYTGETTKTVRYKDMAGEWQEVTVRVNGKYLEIPDAIEKYGYIYSPVSFSDKGSKQALLDEALDHIGATYMPDNFTLKIKAINLRYLDNSVKSIRLGDKVSVQTGKYLPVVITDQNVNPKSKGYYEKDGYSFVKTQDTSIVSGKTYFRKESIVAICSAIDFDFSNPENTEYTIGTKAEGLTSRAGGGGGGGSSGAGYGGAIHECIGYIQGNKKIIDGEILEINTQITTIGGGLTEAQQQLISQGESITAINTDILAFHDNFVMTTTQMHNEYTSSIADLTSDLGTYQQTTSELGNAVADVLVAVHEITGSQIIQDAEHISNFVGTWHEYTDYSTDPPTVSYVYQGGGGLFIEQNNVQFGIWHEGNLTGGMMVEMINDETVTHINGDVIDLQSNRLFTSTVSAIYGDYSRIEQEVDRISLTVSGFDDRYSQIEQTMSSIALTVSDYREGFSQIESTVSSIALTVSNVDGRFSRIENTVSRISLMVQETVSDFSRIETTVSHIRSTVSSHDGRFSQIESTVSSITATVSAHDGRFSQIESTVSSITLTVSSHDGRFSQIENTVSSISLTVSGYEGRMSSIEQYEDEIRIFVGDTTGRFSLIDQQIDSITATVQETEEQFSQIEQRADSIALQVTDLSAGYSRIEQKVDSITSTVADNEDRFSQIEQRVDSITLTVAENEGRFSAIEQTAGSISLRVTDVESSYSEIRTEVDSITLRVEDTEGNYSQIRQTTNEITAAVHDLDDNYAQLKITSDMIESTVYDANGQSRIEQMSDHVSIFVDNFEDANGNFTTSGLHIGQSNLTFGVYTTGTATGNNRELTAGIIVNKVNNSDDPDVYLKGSKIKIGDETAEVAIAGKLSTNRLLAEIESANLVTTTNLTSGVISVNTSVTANEYYIRQQTGGANIAVSSTLEKAIGSFGTPTYSGDTVSIPLKNVYGNFLRDGSNNVVNLTFNRVASVSGSWDDAPATSAYEVTVGNTSSVYLRTTVGTEFTNPANDYYYIQTYYINTEPSGTQTWLTSTAARKRYVLGNTGDGTGASTTIQIENVSGTKYLNTPTMQLFLIDGQDGTAYLRKLVGSEYVTIAQRQIQGQATPSTEVGFTSLIWNNGVGTITLDNDEQQTFTIAAKATDESGSSYPVTASSSDKRYGTIGVVVQSTGSFGSSSNIKGTGDSYTVLVDATENYNAGWADSYGAISISPSSAQTLSPGGSVTVYARGKSTPTASLSNKGSVTITAASVSPRFINPSSGVYCAEVYYTNSSGNATSVTGASLTYQLGLSGSGSSSIVKIFKSDGTTQWPSTPTLSVGSLYTSGIAEGKKQAVVESDSWSGSTFSYWVSGNKTNTLQQTSVTLSQNTKNDGTGTANDWVEDSTYHYLTYVLAKADGSKRISYIAVSGKIPYTEGWADSYDQIAINPSSAQTLSPGGSVTVYARGKSTPTASLSNKGSVTITAASVSPRFINPSSGVYCAEVYYTNSSGNATSVTGASLTYQLGLSGSGSSSIVKIFKSDGTTQWPSTPTLSVGSLYTSGIAEGKKQAVVESDSWSGSTFSYWVSGNKTNTLQQTSVTLSQNTKNDGTGTANDWVEDSTYRYLTYVLAKADGSKRISYIAISGKKPWEYGWDAARGQMSVPGTMSSDHSTELWIRYPSATYGSSVTAKYTVGVDNFQAHIKYGSTNVASISHAVYYNGWNGGGNGSWSTVRALASSDDLSQMTQVTLSPGRTYVVQYQYKKYAQNASTGAWTSANADATQEKLKYFTIPAAATHTISEPTIATGNVSYQGYTNNDSGYVFINDNGYNSVIRTNVKTTWKCDGVQKEQYFYLQESVTSLFKNGYSKGWEAAYYKMSVPGRTPSPLTDTLTIKWPTQARDGQSSTNYVVSVDQTKGYIKFGNTIIAQVDHTQYSDGWINSYNEIAINPSSAQTLSPGGSVTVYARGKSTPTASLGNKASVTVTAAPVGARFINPSSGEYRAEVYYTNSSGNATSVTNAYIAYKLGLSGSNASSVVKIFKSDGTTQWPSTPTLTVGTLYTNGKKAATVTGAWGSSSTSDQNVFYYWNKDYSSTKPTDSSKYSQITIGLRWGYDDGGTWKSSSWTTDSSGKYVTYASARQNNVDRNTVTIYGTDPYNAGKKAAEVNGSWPKSALYDTSTFTYHNATSGYESPAKTTSVTLKLGHVENGTFVADGSWYHSGSTYSMATWVENDAGTIIINPKAILGIIPYNAGVDSVTMNAVTYTNATGDSAVQGQGIVSSCSPKSNGTERKTTTYYKISADGWSGNENVVRVKISNSRYTTSGIDIMKLTVNSPYSNSMTLTRSAPLINYNGTSTYHGIMYRFDVRTNSYVKATNSDVYWYYSTRGAESPASYTVHY